MSERIHFDTEGRAYIRFQGAGYAMPVTVDPETGLAEPVVESAFTEEALLEALANPASPIAQAVLALIADDEPE